MALTTDELRDFLRDKPELNKLISGSETTPEGMQRAIDDAIDDYNKSEPRTFETVDTFPSTSLLKIGASLWVLKSVGTLMSRNHLTYNDGGISIEIDEKTSLYQSWISLFERDWEKGVRELKIRRNIAMGWGGV